MPSQVYLSTTLRFKAPGTDKVWGAAVIVNGSHTQARYVAAWGAYGEEISSKAQPVETLDAAVKRLSKMNAAKKAKGYVEHLYVPMTEFFDQQVVEAPAAPMTLSFEPTPDTTTCGYCALAPTSAQNFWETRCSICGYQAEDHDNDHPHGSVGTSVCKQFSQTPAKWAELGWKPGAQNQQSTEPVHVAARCPTCVSFEEKKKGSLNVDKLYALACLDCDRTIGAHRRDQPHSSLDWSCKTPVFPPEAYTLMGIQQQPPQTSTTVEYSECPNCVVNTTWQDTSKMLDFYRDFTCQRCKGLVAIHAPDHPHERKGYCEGAIYPPDAYKRAGLAPKANKPRQAKTETPEFKLPDLPCDCSHWLNTHATHGEMLESGVELDGRACLVMTCRCEAFRRTCGECKEVTMTTLRHKATCLAGLREKMMLEPTAVPIIRPRYWREQRKIGHLLLPDDDF